MPSGINYFDTAWPYHDGKSEEFLGRVMSKFDRSSFYLADKLPCWHVKSKEDAERIFETQLERLRTGYIDFLSDARPRRKALGRDGSARHS